MSERQVAGLHLRRQFLDQEQPAVERRYRQFRWVRYSAAALGVLTGLSAVAGAVGRATGMYWFASFLPGYKPMPIAVAATLLLLAGTVWALTLSARQAIRLVRGLAGAVIALALLRLIEYAAGADWDVSMLFLSGVLPRSQPQPYHSIPGAIAAIAIAISPVLYTVRNMRLVGLIAAVFGTAMATVVLFGWAFGVQLWGGSPLSPVALPTAIALWCVSSALVMIGVAWELAVRALIEQRREEDRLKLQRQATEMQAQRDLLRDMVTHAPAGMVLLDGRELRVKWFNDDYRQIQNPQYHQTDLAGMRLHDFQPGVEESGVGDILRQVARGELRRFSEYEYPHFERGPTYFNWINVPVPRADGEGFDILVMVIEVTDQVLARKRVEALAEEARQRVEELDTIIESIADGVIVYGASGELLRMNESMRRLLGYTGEAKKFAIQERMERLHFRDAEGRPMEYSDSPPVRALRGETVRGHVVTMHYGTPRQTTSLYSGAPLYDGGGRIIGAVITVADVTALRRTEEALRRSEAVLNRAQEIAHLGSWELDLQTNELTWSDEVYRIFGLEPQAFPGTYEAFLDHVHPDDREAVNEAYLGSVREGRDTYEIEHRVVRARTGEVRIVHERAEHVREADGRIIRSIGMVHDITERKQADEELHRHRTRLEELVEARTGQLQQNQKRLRALASDLVHAEQRERQRIAGLLHDEVAQTLGALKMQLAVLRMKCPEASDELGSSIAMAEDAVKQTRGIMTELSPPVLQRFGLIKAVQWWGEVLHERHGLEVAVTAPEGSIGLDDVMQTALFQAIKELLQNVAKHSGTPQASVEITCGRDEVRVSVRDNGVGFHPGAVTTTDRGSFGLFSIKERFTHLGGGMSVSSAPGEGTTVKLRLPAPCEAPAPPADAPTQ